MRLLNSSCWPKWRRRQTALTFRLARISKHSQRTLQGRCAVSEDRKAADRVAVVTGASGALGSAIVRALLGTRSHVVLVGRCADKLRRLVDELKDDNDRAIPMACDIRRAEQVEALAHSVHERCGRVDVLCTCAGIMRTGRIDEVDPQAWDDLWQTNVNGTYLTIRSFVPFMASPAAVVVIASTAGLRPVPGFAAYTTTKAALIHLAQACALDYVSRGIRVNCLCPGVVRSGIHDALSWPSADMFYASMEQATPLGTIGTPEDIGRAALFLTDAGRGWMTGSVITLDGGLALV